MSIDIIELAGTPIEEQLALEQKLLKEEDGAYLLINDGPPPVIVMGSSQKAEEVIDLNAAKIKNVPFLKRFSAGGCVILDQNTIMISLILHKKILPIDFYPNTIMKWSETFYKNALGLENFSLQGNDYTLDNQKIGGNAQYIKKDRFVHHTSFLWDYDKDHMDLLLHPPKEPSYRNGRHHHDFCTTIAPHLSKKEFISLVKSGTLSHTLLKDHNP